MSSGRFAEVRTPLMLSILMVLMTQVGYLDTMNAWSGDEASLNDAEPVVATGGQGSATYSLVQSTQGEALALNAAMDPITFGYAEGADAAPIYGNGSLWTVSTGGVMSLISPQRLTANNSMFSNDVFFFSSGSCALSMHNISNGTTWEEFDVTGCTSTAQFYRSFSLLAQTFIFEIYDGTDKGQIWAHNVSNATTWRVGGGTYSSGAVTTQSKLFQHGNDVWFYSNLQLYRINGSTFEVEQRSDFSGGSQSYHYDWAYSNGSIYFVAKPESVGLELYRHEIASNQSYRVIDFNPSGDGVYNTQAVSDDVLILRARNSSSNGISMWAHNTTTNQTYEISNLSFGSDRVFVDDVMYSIYASTTGTGMEPHAYSFANNSTWLLKDIYSGSSGSGVPMTYPIRFSPHLQAHNGLLYMLRNGGASQGGVEVWVHDPSTTETYRVSDISGSDEVVNIIGAAGDTVYFTTKKNGYCCYMYAHSSTSNSTYELTNFPDGRYYQTGARFFLPINGTVYMNGGYQPSGLVAWSPNVIETASSPVSGATCSVSPSLPSGMVLNQGNCTVTGTPTTLTPHTNYTLTATINGQTYGATFWLTTDYLPLTPSVADLDATVGAPIEPITFVIPTGAEAGDGGYDAPYNSNVSTMLSGDYHTCAILSDRSMACWGDNQFGQLGDGTTTGSSTPVAVNLPAGSSVASIPAYAADHSCAVLDNGSVYCWGLASAFSPGSSSPSNPQHLPLPAGRTPVSIEADHLSTCVVLDNGSMMCIGSNSYNRLGYNGSATGAFSYVEYLPQGAIVVDMSLAQDSACALLEDGDVWCWGSNTWDQLGVTGSGTYNYAVQPNIPSGTISAIEGHIGGHCSLYDNGSVACWGKNSDGERGIGNYSTQSTLGILFTQPMPGSLPVTSIATGDHTVCAQLSNGSVACWGEYIANGYASDTNTPTLIPWPHGAVQATAISVGWYHGCALLENGSMWCWGQNSYGQLGNGTTTASSPWPGTFVDLDLPVRGPPAIISGATCSVDPALPAGLSIAQGNCTISGTPTGTSSTTTYTVYANTSAGTSRSEISITVVANPMYPSMDGAQLRVDQVMTNITFQYGSGPFDVSGATSCTSTPTLPAGLSVESSNCTISGTPTAAAVNTTYMVTAEIGGTTYAAELWLEVLGLIGPVVGVNNTLLPDVQPMYTGANLTYEVEPSLPASLSLNATTGVISGTPTETLGNTTFTLYANDTNGDSLQWNISIEILEDTDGDGLPNLLPPDYDGENDDHRATPGLTEDLDDDNDGLNDTNETDTGSYVDESDTGTDPLDPDTDDDGFCDGPIAVPGVCFAGPDPYPHDPNLPIDTDGDGLPDNDDDWDGPPYADEDDDGDGYPDNSELACGSDPLDPSSLPEDMDGDGICDGDDLDMDGDGIDNVNETGLPVGTLPNNPDTDGDGICDGPVSPVSSNCTAGPDAFPLDPSAGTDTDGDGMPDELFPGVNSTSEPPLIEDLDDDNDNWSDIDEVNCLTDPLNASSIPVDTNGDGLCDLMDDDWDDDGIPNANETDTGTYVNESDTGTDPWNPDTDGDGFCDGPLGVMNGSDVVCIAGPDPFPHDPNLPIDTDGDGMPDDLPPGYEGNLVADEDDDNDGFSDASENACGSDPLDDTSHPDDMDGDAICDGDDLDMDGDGIPNEDELGLPLDTSPSNPDSDGDGVCDGPEAPANGGCVAGPDAFPLDPAGAKDTDGDGKPDTLVPGATSTSVPPLVEDLDDDNDTWSDFDEGACGTDPLDEFSTPTDTDGDGLCDALDPYLDLPFTLEYPTQYVDLFVNQTMDPLLPWVNGSGDVVTWELVGELPEGLTFGWSPARDAMMDGSIRGTPLNATETVNLTIWANNSVYSESFALSLTVFNDSDNDSLPDELPEGYVGNLTADLDDDNDGLPDDKEIACGSDPMDNQSGESEWVAVCLDVGGGDDDDGINWMWCFPCLLLLLLLLIIPLLLGRDRLLVFLADGPEPEYTTAEPNFVAGSGTEDDPFILAPVGPLQPGSMESTVEEITITNMGDIKIDMVDFNDEDNYGRFSMYESAFSMEGTRVLAVGKDGEVVINFKFDDREFPTYEGGTYTGRIKLGKASVYFLWEVTVMADEQQAKTEKKKTMDRIKKRKKAFNFDRIGKATKKNADDLQAIKGIGPYSEEKLNALGIFTYAQLANFDRQTEDEVNDAIEHYKGRIRRDEWVKQARDIIGAEAKADEEALKAAEEAQAKAEAEAKAAEEAEAAKKAEEAAAAAAAAAAEKEAKDAEKKAKAEADKKAKEEAAAKKKADAEAKKAAAAEKEAKEAEKKAKAEADKKAKEEAAAAKPVTKEAKKEEELKRVKERSKSIDFKVLGTAKASDKDDLQAIKGIGPFIEEKLNALGIYTWLQISKMTDKLEDQVNEAIEFFPGRVKRDQWVNQAKILLGEDVKLDEKALKQAEELERVAAKAESIDFATLGVASASDKDDLKAIKGIGPFIEEKLNALGIYTFEQVSKMTAKIEEEVNVAIEFFPGRVKRDEWAKQAKKLHKEKK